jgi:ABC-type nitrate/sulfonate/bicarbonate transport system permease component
MILERFVKAIARGVIAILIVAILWQLAAVITGNAILMPALPAVFGRLGKLLINASFWGEAGVSVLHLVLGYVPALIGIPLGLAFAAVVPLRFLFGGFFNGLAGVPLIASAPLMTGWFGMGDNGKIMLVFVVALFALTSDVMTDLARSAVPNRAPEEAPGAARAIIAALRRSFVLAVTAALVGEMLASTHGLGYLLMNSIMIFDLPQTVAVFIVVALPCAVVVAIARGAEGTV